MGLLPGTPPELGEDDRGYFVPGTLGEWTIRTTLGDLVLHEQRERREVPVPRRKALYPNAPLWWASVEVLRGMAARMPHLVALCGSKMMGEALGGPYHIILAPLWAVKVADVFVSSIRRHGHFVASASGLADGSTGPCCCAQQRISPRVAKDPPFARSRVSWPASQHPTGLFLVIAAYKHGRFPCAPLSD